MLLTPSCDGLIIQEKQKIGTVSGKAIPRKKYKPLDQRKIQNYYSARVGEKVGIMRQFYKAMIFIGEETDKKMVQEVAPLGSFNYYVLTK